MEVGVKHLIVETPDYKAYLEKTEHNELFFHFDYLTKWTKEKRKEVIQVIEAICSSTPYLIWALPEVNDKKIKTFTKLTGFKAITDVMCKDGVKRTLYLWRK